MCGIWPLHRHRVPAGFRPSQVQFVVPSRAEVIPLSAIDKDHADAYFEHMHPVLPISPWSNTKELARDLQSVPSATVSG